MAFVMPLRPPALQMNRILNVEQRVGPESNCPNNPNDVEAVQRLIAIGCRRFAGVHGFGLPQPTGRYDPLTGFYIYRMQVWARSDNPGAIVDGIVSPARGESYGPGAWTIGNFNYQSFKNHRAEWEAVLAMYPSRSRP